MWLFNLATSNLPYFFTSSFVMSSLQYMLKIRRRHLRLKASNFCLSLSVISQVSLAYRMIDRTAAYILWFLFLVLYSLLSRQLAHFQKLFGLSHSYFDLIWSISSLTYCAPKVLKWANIFNVFHVYLHLYPLVVESIILKTF